MFSIEISLGPVLSALVWVTRPSLAQKNEQGNELLCRMVNSLPTSVLVMVVLLPLRLSPMLWMESWLLLRPLLLSLLHPLSFLLIPLSPLRLPLFLLLLLWESLFLFCLSKMVVKWMTRKMVPLLNPHKPIHLKLSRL
jgi:hypothetical protein